MFCLLLFNVGSVFVSKSIRNFKCTQTTEKFHISDIKSIEQPIYPVGDNSVALNATYAEERILNINNNDAFIDANATTEVAVLNTEDVNLLDATANFEGTIDFNAVTTENNFDIQNDNVVLDTDVTNETTMIIANDNVLPNVVFDEKKLFNHS
ncbi:hypothetical protein CEXT_508201 [Caerostris extrusa]|uniref:Uncharacterized protein n=1 Tax=Caerostris extrusa TaxID=172846 RepID=A0AAV4NWR8_CAEEX|nr:hypothetical protein CEXT_508201 [Caerostris extrusa]